MSTTPEKWNPYRVSRSIDPTGPTLTRSQQLVLLLLVEHCPQLGTSMTSRVLSDHAGKRLGSIMLVLRKLEDKRLAACVDAAGGVEGACVWMPTMLGRARRRPGSPTRAVGGGGSTAAGGGAPSGAATPTARVTLHFADVPSPVWSDGLGLHDDRPDDRVAADAFLVGEVWPDDDPFVVVDDVFAGMRDAGDIPVEEPAGEERADEDRRAA